MWKCVWGVGKCAWGGGRSVERVLGGGNGCWVGVGKRGGRGAGKCGKKDGVTI